MKTNNYKTHFFFYNFFYNFFYDFFFISFKYFFSIKNKLNMTKIKLYKFPHNTKYDLYYAP